MTKIRDYANESLLMSEGAAPATPATGTVRIYAKADGLLYSKDDAGTETPLGGGGGGSGDVVGPASSTDSHVALFDGTTGKLLKDGGAPLTNPMTTAGDIITGGTSGAVQRLSAGTNGYVLTMVSGAPAWAASSGGGSDNITIVTEASTSTMDPATHSGRSKLILAADDVTFDSTEGYTAGDVFNICATSALDLLVSGVTLTPPSGGTTGLSADMTVSVVMTSSTAGRIIGQTVAA